MIVLSSLLLLKDGPYLARSDLTGLFDWAWSDLTGLFDWARSELLLTRKYGSYQEDYRDFDFHCYFDCDCDLGVDLGLIDCPLVYCVQ